MIDAIVELRKKYPVHLLLVGDGPYKDTLATCVLNANASRYVHFLGRRSDVNTILANSDIFVLSSNHEGLPNSLMEAMAMGLPCVATDVGGVRQLITDETKGIVVSPKSSTDIVAAVAYYIENCKEMETIGRNAYDVMRKNYEQQAVAEELLTIYKKY